MRVLGLDQHGAVDVAMKLVRLPYPCPDEIVPRECFHAFEGFLFHQIRFFLLIARSLHPNWMDKGLKGRKIVGILLFRSDPEIDFHPCWVGLAAGKSSLHGIVNFVSLGIP